ncbi:hypothetical protein [Actinacidiphila yanglinensis]|uniref:hypothetical protein n=1 Tax=Actinacidiphila yanglinensis TaxID=310779 RepID=UPI0011AFF6FB|nr:hypothetical protein [Actinacidiphila yanglinensis]
MPVLEDACALLAQRPLDQTLAELDTVLGRPLPEDGGRRLHVLVSTLYHQAGAPLDLTEDLRARIEGAQSTTVKE